MKIVVFAIPAAILMGIVLGGVGIEKLANAGASFREKTRGSWFISLGMGLWVAAVITTMLITTQP